MRWDSQDIPTAITLPWMYFEDDVEEWLFTNFRDNSVEFAQKLRTYYDCIQKYGPHATFCALDFHSDEEPCQWIESSIKELAAFMEWSGGVHGAESQDLEEAWIALDNWAEWVPEDPRAALLAHDKKWAPLLGKGPEPFLLGDALPELMPEMLPRPIASSAASSPQGDATTERAQPSVESAHETSARSPVTPARAKPTAAPILTPSLKRRLTGKQAVPSGNGATTRDTCAGRVIQKSVAKWSWKQWGKVRVRCPACSGEISRSHMARHKEVCAFRA